MSQIRRPSVNLPPAPAVYDQREQNEFRRIVMQALSESVEDLVRPRLELTKSISATAYSITWDGSPNVQVSIDGAAFTTPGASPISASRNASGGLIKQYAFRAGPDSTGKYLTQVIDVLPQEAVAPTDARFTSGYCSGGSTPGDGGGEVEITFTHENFPGGWSVDIALSNITGDPITATSGSGTGYTASPATVSVALGARAEFDVTLTETVSGAELTFHVYAVPA